RVLHDRRNDGIDRHGLCTKPGVDGGPAIVRLCAPVCASYTCTAGVAGSVVMSNGAASFVSPNESAEAASEMPASFFDVFKSYVQTSLPPVLRVSTPPWCITTYKRLSPWCTALNCVPPTFQFAARS